MMTFCSMKKVCTFQFHSIEKLFKCNVLRSKNFSKTSICFTKVELKGVDDDDILEIPLASKVVVYPYGMKFSNLGLY